MKIAKSYCREIARALNLIPIFPPGKAVKTGDIIRFDRKLFRRKPIGNFTLVATLENLGITYEMPREDVHPDPIYYSSRKAVEANLIASSQVNGIGGSNAAANGKLTISFKKEGAIYLAAVDCVQTQMADMANVQAQLNQYNGPLDLEHCFLVTGVYKAKKALIMVASSQSAEMVIEGDVEGLQTNSPVTVNAQASVRVTQHKDAAFIKDWSDEVEVFFSLVRLPKKLGRGNGAGHSVNGTQEYLAEEVAPLELAV